MKKNIAIILSLLLLCAHAIGYAGDQEERTTIIGCMLSPEDVNREENTIYLRSFCFGWFHIKLPQDVSIDDVITYEHIKVTFEEPLSKSQIENDDLGLPVSAVAIEEVPFLMGKIIEQTDNYIDLEIWTFPDDRERDGETQRFLLNDTPFTRPTHAGEFVYIPYEIDEVENYVALLIIVSDG